MKTEQQLQNIRDALVWWQTVPPENVVPGLGWWRDEEHEPVTCGTIACFGGWCAVQPLLVAQGVHVEQGSGAPRMKGKHSVLRASEVAGEIFGDACLFGSRGFHRADEGFTGTDHELVTYRLECALAQG